MKYGLSQKQLQEIIEIISSYQEVDKAIIFGSRAIDTFKEASDVDIAIIGEKCDLLLSAKIKGHLEDETYLPFFFDIIAYNSIKSQELKKHIQNKGKVIFQREEEWKEVRLGELLKFGNGKKKPNSSGNTPIYGGNGILGYCSENNYRNETIIIGRVGAYCGSVYFENKPIWISDNALSAKPKANNNLKFMFYFLKLIDLNSYAGGSSHPLITQTLLNSLEFNTCSDPIIQKTIAEVLSSLDDKIDLLHRQNKTLEEMAETLFRQWFIEERDESWEETTLDKCVDIAIGRTPPRQQSQWFSTNKKDVKWISIKDMGCSGSYIFNTSEYLTQEAIEKFNIPVIPKNTVVLSFKMTVGRVAITSETMLSNEAIAHFKFNKNTPFTKEYLYLFLKTFKYETLGSTSSIVTSINSRMIKKMFVIVPKQETIKNFNSHVAQYFNKIRANQIQLDILEKLRDNLLPKLMSGEVRIKIANKGV